MPVISIVFVDPLSDPLRVMLSCIVTVSVAII